MAEAGLADTRPGLFVTLAFTFSLGMAAWVWRDRLVLHWTWLAGVWALALALSATPANAEGGKAFINFMLSKEAQEILDSVGRRSVRTDVVTKNALRPLSQIKVINYNDDWAGANRARILAKWNDMLLNKK